MVSWAWRSSAGRVGSCPGGKACSRLASQRRVCMAESRSERSGRLARARSRPRLEGTGGEVTGHVAGGGVRVMRGFGQVGKGEGGGRLGKAPEDMTSGQISYDLRRLRAHQIIERIPRSRAYQVTQDGLTIALFLTRLTQRLLIPGLAQLTSPGPPGRSRLRQADRAYRDTLTDLTRQASLAAFPPPAAITHSNHASASDRHQPSHTTQLDSKLKIPAGKDNLRPYESSDQQRCGRAGLSYVAGDDDLGWGDRLVDGRSRRL